MMEGLFLHHDPPASQTRSTTSLTLSSERIDPLSERKRPPSHVGALCLCHERHASLRDRQLKAVRCQPSERATKFLCQGCLIKKYPSNSPPLLQARHYRCIQKPTSTHRNPLKISYINLNSLKFSPIRAHLGLPGTLEEKFEKFKIENCDALALGEFSSTRFHIRVRWWLAFFIPSVSELTSPMYWEIALWFRYQTERIQIRNRGWCRCQKKPRLPLLFLLPNLPEVMVQIPAVSRQPRRLPPR